LNVNILLSLAVDECRVMRLLPRTAE